MAPTAEDLGLTRKQIHEARIIRDVLAGQLEGLRLVLEEMRRERDELRQDRDRSLPGW